MWMLFYFVLTARYLGVKQQIKIDKLTNLVNGMSKRKNTNNYWDQFSKITNQILQLMSELSRFNGFWSPQLTIYILGDVVMICYMTYPSIFGVEGATLFQRNFYIFFTIEFLAMLIFLVYECSIIVNKNVKLYKLNRRFAYAYSKLQQPRVSHLLKLSKMVSNYRGSRTGFRFINNSLIDSRMFEIVSVLQFPCLLMLFLILLVFQLGISISILFMKLFKKKNYNKDYFG